jgi:enediyne biosynthesis protein E4
MLKMRKSLRYHVFLFALAITMSCTDKKEARFRLISEKESGVTFSNDLKPTVDFNIFNYLYFYNGGGVATGDLNSDGLLDLYFTANQKANKLYINQGDFKFKDVTELAGITGKDGWKTGVTMADVNADGKLDIYISYLGDYRKYKGKNQLFINQGNDANGIPKFTDLAAEYGLDLVGFSTQASFFDYDRDGDLDMFMLTHSVHGSGTFGKSSLRQKSHPLAGDRLMRNDNGRFVDVTQGSGVYNSVLGYGLGVVVSDVNMDGWPDIFVGNDFHENDYLYLNQGDGTFKEVVEQQMMHTSRYTMGVDFADFNNDGFPDLIAMDMLPDDPQRLKASMAEDPYDVYKFKINFGYNHQFTRNMLQLNNQDGTFSEIGLMAGVAATDWSWSTFFADFDLDGRKDIFVSNGILRRSNDLDYINFIEADSVQRKLGQGMGERELKLTDKMPKVKIPNFLFVNSGDSTFRNVASEWGLDMPTCSQGAAYADLDNDGDLDLVVNNMDEVASIYENTTISKSAKKRNDTTTAHFLQVVLKGKGGNTYGIGAKVFIFQDGNLQMQESMPTRGFQSAVDYRLTFGLGKNKKIDSLLVIWPDASFERVSDVPPNRQLTLDQVQASGAFDYSYFHPRRQQLFQRIGSPLPNYRHQENPFVEFDREALIPHMLSAEGPAAAVGDVNGDGLDDLFLSNGKRAASQLFIQQKNNSFVESSKPLFEAEFSFENTGAEFADVDGDGDLDLLLVPGGNEFTGNSKYRKVRVHLNDGKGNFTPSSLLADVYTTGSCVQLADIDGDTDLDVFIGGRSLPWNYGKKTDSFILLNEGNGYVDVTDRVAPSLRNFGFVKDATWADIDHDKDVDLIIAAEWSPLTILLNEKGKLIPLDSDRSGLKNTNGWWQTVKAADLDQDGDIDFVAGNMGLNSKLTASVEHPVKMYVDDFDKNDSLDQVLTHWMGGKEYPFHTRDEMTKQMPYLKKRYLSYEKFSQATVNDMFTEDQLSSAEQYVANTFSSVWVENIGGNRFKIHDFPKAAQISSINSILVDDFDSDGVNDLLLAGNFYPINIQLGRYDASYGLFLKGKGNGTFTVVPAFISGFSVSGEVRSLKKMTIGGKVHYLAIRNNNTIEAFTIKQ